MTMMTMMTMTMTIVEPHTQTWATIPTKITRIDGMRAEV